MKDGYLRINLHRNNGQKCNKYLHQVVAWAFIPNPENKPELHHIDEDKLNNHWTNLMWVTKKEHAEISKLNEQISHKISRADVVWIRDNYSENTKYELANKFKVAANTIYNIAIGTARTDIKEGKISPPVGLYKKIINIETNEILTSSRELSLKTGWKIKDVHRRLNGERYNDTPYRYIGMEHVCLQRPEKIYIPDLIAKFKDGTLVETIDRKKIYDQIFNQRIGAFLNGNSRSVDGFTYKKVTAEGDFIEPPKFIPVPKKVKKPVTPGKELIKYDINGNELDRFNSIGDAARNMKTEKKSFRGMINKSPRGYYKGFIWKYA
jgi:hypothetical protein